MTLLTITHTPAEGTILTGDPRPHHQLVKDAGWRWSRNIGADGAWYVPRSRDTRPNVPAIGRLVVALEAVGFTVAVDLDDTLRSFDEIDADRAERAEARADGLDRKAERLHAESDAADERFRAIADMIPVGQPILVGHHSEKRHRRDIARMEDNLRKGVEAHREGVETERRAGAARATQAHRESVPAMIRRAERLEAESRKLVRDTLTPCKGSGVARKADAPVVAAMQCPICWRTVPVVLADGGRRRMAEHGMATGAAADDYRSRVARLDEEAAHLRAKVNDAKDAGADVWGPDDFVKGDLVHDRFGRRRPVLRVNKKSVTVQSDYSWTETIPYDDVRGHTPKAEIEAGS